MKYALALTLALAPTMASAEPLTNAVLTDYLSTCRETADMTSRDLVAFYLARHNRDYEKAINNIAVCTAYTTGRRDGMVEVRDIMTGVK